MDEKKQIEEMTLVIARLFCNPKGCYNCNLCDAYGSLELSCEDYLSYRRMASVLYAAGYRKQSGWISVDEKLPPKREWVICYSPNKKSLPIFLGRIGNYSDDWQQEGGYICMTPVTHWMPLPERPKGD